MSINSPTGRARWNHTPAAVLHCTCNCERPQWRSDGGWQYREVGGAIQQITSIVPLFFYWFIFFIYRFIDATLGNYTFWGGERGKTNQTITRVAAARLSLATTQQRHDPNQVYLGEKNTFIFDFCFDRPCYPAVDTHKKKNFLISENSSLLPDKSMIVAVPLEWGWSEMKMPGYIHLEKGSFETFILH